MSKVATKKHTKNSGTNCKELIGYIDLYELKTYENEHNIFKTNSGKYQIINNRFVLSPKWVDINKNYLECSKDCYIYIFRSTGNFYTIYDEFKADDKGKYHHFDVLDDRKARKKKDNKKSSPQKDERKETNHRSDRIAIALRESGKSYDYYILTSPFRLSYERVDDILDKLESSDKNLLSFIIHFSEINFKSDVKSKEGKCYFENSLKLLAPNYIKVATNLYTSILDKMKVLYDFLNPPNIYDKKILMFSEMIHQQIKREDKLKNCIKEYYADKNLIEYRLNSKVTQELKLDFNIDWELKQVVNGGKSNRNQSNFKFNDNCSYLEWRHRFNCKKQYLQEEIEIIGALLTRWVKQPGYNFSLASITYGSYSGSGVKASTQKLSKDFTMTTLKSRINTGEFFDEDFGGELYESFKGLINHLLNQTQSGQVLIKKTAIKLYKEKEKNKKKPVIYPTYTDMFKADPDREYDFENSLLGIFTVTRRISNGLGLIMECYSMHVLTYIVKIRKLDMKVTQTKAFIETIVNASASTFKARKISIIRKKNISNSKIKSVSKVNSSLFISKKNYRQKIKRQALTEIEFSSQAYDLTSSKLAKFNNAVDVINVGIGFLQVVSGSKEKLSAKDLLALGDLIVNFIDLLKVTSKAGSKLLGGISAVFTTVSTGLDAAKESNQNDDDSAIALWISTGASFVTVIGFISAMVFGGPISAAIILISGVVAGVAAIISIFLDNSDMELILLNCFWGKEYLTNRKDKDISSWSIEERYKWNYVSKALPRHVGNLDLQLQALTNAVYDYKIKEFEYTHRNLKNEKLGLVYIQLENGFLEQNSQIKIKLCLLDKNNKKMSKTTTSFYLESGKNILYNITDTKKVDHTVLEEGEKLNNLSCFIAIKPIKSLDRWVKSINPAAFKKNTVIVRGISGIIYNILYHANYNAIMKTGYSKNIKKCFKNVVSEKVDYYDKIQNYRDDKNSYCKLKLTVELFPGSDRTGTTKPVKKTKIIKC